MRYLDSNPDSTGMNSNKLPETVKDRESLQPMGWKESAAEQQQCKLKGQMDIGDIHTYMDQEHPTLKSLMI